VERASARHAGNRAGIFVCGASADHARLIRLRFTPDGKRVLATEPDSNAVRVYDAATRKLIHFVPVEGLPVSVALTPDGKRAYVVGAGAEKVYEIDLDKLSITRAFPTGPGPGGVAVL
jgi:YVTN family beta-propeller protein